MDGPSSSSDHVTEQSVREDLPDLAGQNLRVRTLQWIIVLCAPRMISHGTRVSTLVTRSHHCDRAGERASGRYGNIQAEPEREPLAMAEIADGVGFALHANRY